MLPGLRVGIKWRLDDHLLGCWVLLRELGPDVLCAPHTGKLPLF